MNQGMDEDIVIHPKRGRNEKHLPKNGILVVNPSEASHYHRQLRLLGGESRSLFNSDLTVSEGHSFFIAGPAIGAPMAVLTMEKLIALGAKRIVLFGWCGAISTLHKVGDVLLPNTAKSGEGTSQYYYLSQQATPSNTFRTQIEKVFLEKNTIVHSGCVWSTDAVYRESRKMLAELSLIGKVAAVDMEFSALCTVACFRDIEFAAVLVVSDELWGKTWKPGFSSDVFIETKARTMNLLLAAIDSFGE